MQQLTAIKRISGAVLVAILVPTLGVGPSVSSAWADGGGGGGCIAGIDPTCSVGASGGGGPGSASDGGGGGGPTSDPCAAYPAAAYGSKPPAVSQACADELQANYCDAM